MEVVKKLILNKTDLDHILDVEILERDKGVPPSLIFLEGLVNELEFSGINLEDIDVIELNLG